MQQAMGQVVEQVCTVADGLEAELAAARQEATDLRAERDQVGNSTRNAHEHIITVTHPNAYT
jgi:hypothetical protein